MNGEQAEAMIMIIVMPTMFVIFGWAFKTMLNFFQTRSHMKLHYALQDKLLDKLGTSPEALEYLRSGASEDVFAFATQERGNPYGRILSALQAGAVLSLLQGERLLPWVLIILMWDIQQDSKLFKFSKVRKKPVKYPPALQKN